MTRRIAIALTSITECFNECENIRKSAGYILHLQSFDLIYGLRDSVGWMATTNT